MPPHEDNYEVPQDISVRQSTGMVLQRMGGLSEETLQKCVDIGDAVNEIGQHGDNLAHSVLDNVSKNPELENLGKEPRFDSNTFEGRVRAFCQKHKHEFSAERVKFYFDVVKKLINNGEVSSMPISDAPKYIKNFIKTENKVEKARVVAPGSIGFIIMLGSIETSKLTFFRLEAVSKIALDAAARFMATGPILTRENTNLGQLRKDRNGDWSYQTCMSITAKENLSEKARLVHRICRLFVLKFIDKQRRAQHHEFAREDAKKCKRAFKKVAPQFEKNLQATVRNVSEMGTISRLQLARLGGSAREGAERAAEFIQELDKRDERLGHVSKKARSSSTNPP